jgi:radical SAM family uncharacterized protein/radical SAM-linked protein
MLGVDFRMHPYVEFLEAVERPCRYLGGEYLQVVKDPASVAASVALAFPDLYDVGMSHLGTKILYSLLNRDPRIAAERVFAPWPDLEAELRRRGLPLVTLETARPLSAFDVVGVSLQYELTYTNVLLMLDLGGIPLRAAARGPADPIVLCGGPVASHAEPLAPFVDAFFLGEAEELLPALVCAIAAGRAAGVPRGELLGELAGRYPLYVPSLYRVVARPDGLLVVDGPTDPRVPARPRRALVTDLDRFPFPDDAPVAHAEAIFDRAGVEIARGCTEGCRFCQAGMIYRPVRERGPEAIVDAVLRGVRRAGYDETSLTALSTADYSVIVPLMEQLLARLKDEHVSLGLSSLRAYGLPESLLAQLAQLRMTGLTFAPEAGTQRLRDVISKNVSEADIEETARRVFGLGFRRIKLYFMLGLPTETDEDVRAIAQLGGRLQRLGKRLVRGAEVTVSVSTHVPKPHTPFQWCAMDPLAEILRKQRFLRDVTRAERLSFKWHEAATSVIEGVLGRGDRRLADALEAAYRAGARFDGWDEHFSMRRWEAALASAGLRAEEYLAAAAPGDRLPWDHLDMQLDPAFLEEEYRLALRGRPRPPCGKTAGRPLHPQTLAEAQADDRPLVCYQCGLACDLDAMRARRARSLEALGATGPAAPPAAEPAPAPAGPQQPVPGAGFNSVPGQRFRVRVTKLGPAAYLGHLDYLRLLPRIARRAGVPLFYSSGFHPKPDIAASPALGLGTPSLGEIFDLRLDAAAPALGPAELCARLDAAAPAGVRFVGACALGENDAGLGRLLQAADFAVETAALGPDAAAAAARLQALAGGPATVTRVQKDRERRIPVGALVLEAWAAGPALDCDALGLQAPVCVVRLRLSPEGSLRPQEAVEAALGAAPAVRPRSARVGLWLLADAPVDPLAIDEVRAAARRRKEPAAG